MGFIDQKKIYEFRSNLSSLEIRSVKHYWDEIQNEKNNYEKQKEVSIISTFTEDMEYYFYTLLQMKYIDQSNINYVIHSFSNISFVEPMPKDLRKFFGLTSEKKIYINPEMNGFHHLNDKDFKQLIISHELGHILNCSWKEESVRFAEELYSNPRVRKILKNMGLDQFEYLKEGFELLDEVITQELAEEVTYFKMNKKRPRKECRQDKAIFEFQPYYTNFLLYGEFEDVAIAFAKTISSLHCHSNDSDDVVLQKLVKASFDKDFISKMKDEFLNESVRLDFFIMMLAIMGKMKDATYQFVGLNQHHHSLSINPMISSYYEIARMNQMNYKTRAYAK